MAGIPEQTVPLRGTEVFSEQPEIIQRLDAAVIVAPQIAEVWDEIAEEAHNKSHEIATTLVGELTDLRSQRAEPYAKSLQIQSRIDEEVNRRTDLDEQKDQQEAAIKSYNANEAERSESIRWMQSKIASLELGARWMSADGMTHQLSVTEHFAYLGKEPYTSYQPDGDRKDKDVAYIAELQGQITEIQGYRRSCIETSTQLALRIQACDETIDSLYQKLQAITNVLAGIDRQIEDVLDQIDAHKRELEISVVDSMPAEEPSLPVSENATSFNKETTANLVDTASPVNLPVNAKGLRIPISQGNRRRLWRGVGATLIVGRGANDA